MLLGPWSFLFRNFQKISVFIYYLTGFMKVTFFLYKNRFKVFVDA